jgi:hypothetical protein
MADEPCYSKVADEQLDEIELSRDRDLYNDLVNAREDIVDNPGRARQRSAAITTTEGVRFRFPLQGRPPYTIVWTSASEGPRIEPVFPYPT